MIVRMWPRGTSVEIWLQEFLIKHRSQKSIDDEEKFKAEEFNEDQGGRELHTDDNGVNFQTR